MKTDEKCCLDFNLFKKNIYTHFYMGMCMLGVKNTAYREDYLCSNCYRLFCFPYHIVPFNQCAKNN